MIIVVSNKGQLCNKIWSYVSIITYAIQYNQKIIIADFVEYVSLFPNLRNKKSIIAISTNHRRKWLNRILRVLKKIKLLDVFDYNKLIKRFSLVNGWDYRFDTTYFTQERVDFIKYLFTPAETVIEKCSKIIKTEQVDGVIIVGVHIRRGDYREFENGKLCYSDETYLKYMLKVKERLEKNNIKFLICSNEKINLSAFNQVSVFQIPDATGVDDLYALSLCDYIIGPPSTFSMWASFYGNKPLLILNDCDSEVNLNNFEVICKTT